MPIGFAGPALQGISLLSRFGVPALQQAGIAAGMYGLGALADSFSKTPSQGNVPTRNRRANVGRNDTNYSGIIGSIPPSANGESYRDAELRLGNRGGSGGNAGYSTSTFNAPSALQGGGGFGGGGGSQYQGPSSFTPLDPYAAQNREYERERARVEAMVKANPDMQKQAIADERAKVRDQGMALWAKANPTLAKQVQPGAVGYDVVQQALIGNNAGQAARQAFGYQTPQQITLTPPPGVNAPQSFPPVESITPTETYGAQGIQTDPEMVKKFQTLLNLTKK
jgi:hypothetical protein